jgi:AcrR family transcriptional regulator
MPRKKPAPPPSTQRGEATRAKILEAAHGLFLKHGFHGASMRQIADGAGLALGGIYNHFSGKEEIFAAVLDAYHPYHVVLPALNETQGETVEAFVRDAAQRIRAGFAGAETQLLPLVFIEFVEFQGRHLKQLAEKILPPMLSFIQRFAGRRGKLRPIPQPVMLLTFMGLMGVFLMSQMALKGTPLLKQSRDDWFGGLVDIYLHGILEPEA